MVEIPIRAEIDTAKNPLMEKFEENHTSIKYLTSIKDRVLIILDKHETARNSDWKLLEYFSWYFGKEAEAGTIIRLRAEIQNEDKKYLPTDEVREKRREIQSGVRHRYGGQ